MKKTKNTLILISCILIINIIWLLVLLINRAPKSEVENVKSSTSQNSSQFQGLKVKNPADMLDMDLGKTSSSKVLNHIQDYITKFLPDIYNKIKSNTDFNEAYFEENKDTIYKYSRINGFSDFTKLVDKMKQSEINFDNYDSVEFGSVTEDNDAIVIQCVMYYSGSDKGIVLELSYLNGKMQSIDLKI